MPMTLEEAQARILELEEENTDLRNQRDTLSQNNETLETDLESVRKLNQQYFNKLTAQYNADLRNGNSGDEDEDVQSCEDFAKTLKI